MHARAVKFKIVSVIREQEEMHRVRVLLAIVIPQV
jgi:hypothetical protein